MITDILPTEYIPLTVEDFFGPAREVAKSVMKHAEVCRKRNAPAAYLFLGPSGTGKTALALWTIRTAYEINSWNIHDCFGGDLTVDRVREIAVSMHLTSLYPGFRAFFFDELDKCSQEARARLLELVGDRKQPKGTIIVATSNLTADEFDRLEKSEGAKGRLTSRFSLYDVVGPTAPEAAPLLAKWLPTDQADKAAIMAATGIDGSLGRINVRAVLRDIERMITEQ